MSKSNKPVPKPDNVADKLRDSLNMGVNKPDTVNANLGSPITPLQTLSSGLTSAATSTTTSSCSSSSSGTVRRLTGQSSVTRKSDSGRPIPSAAQSLKSSTPSASQPGSSNQAGGQLKTTSTSASQSSMPSAPSASQSSKSSAPSASQSSKSSAQSKPSIPPAAKSSKGTSPSGAQSGSSSSSPKTATGNLRAGRSAATSDSVSGTAKPLGKGSTSPRQPVKIPPCGNLFPSGKVKITGMTQGNPTSKVLGSGSQSYGYGSIMRGSTFSHTKPTKPAPISIVGLNAEEVKKRGNEMFKQGYLTEALRLYDRAIELSPRVAIYHSNRAAALMGLGRIGEAVIECEEAIKLDPNFVRAHHRLATLLLRLGQVDNAGMHFYSVEDPSDPMVVKKLQLVDTHLNKCTDARRRGEWNIVLKEVCAAMESGADASPQLAMCKVEALLKLVRLEDAQTELAFVPKVEPFPVSFSQTRFFDMICDAYISFVKSQVELALGRFENAVTAAEKASYIDPTNTEVEKLYREVKLITRARDRGNNLYESERYTEARTAYAEGLKFDPYNAALYSHRADCFFKVGMWESSIEDYNQALLILPSYTKPRLQRAVSYSKLERWAEAVRDYEILKREMPYDKEMAESLFHAQVALRKSRGEVVLNMEFGGEVEEISSLEELKAALTRPGVSIVHFLRASDEQCKQMCVFMDALCIRYPNLHFLKVDIGKCPAVGDAERVKVVPTFKIYKLGIRIKEIACPSKEALENSVRHYSL